MLFISRLSPLRGVIYMSQLAKTACLSEPSKTFKKINRQLINLVPENHPCRKGTSSSKPSFLGMYETRSPQLILRLQRTTLGPADVRQGGFVVLGAWLVLLSSPCHLCHPYHLCRCHPRKVIFFRSQNMAMFYFQHDGCIFLRMGVAITR